VTEIFNRKLLKTNRARYAKRFSEFNFLHQEVAERLIERISDLGKNFENILEIGARDGNLGKKIPHKFLVQTDLSLDFAGSLENGIMMDDENLCFAPNSFDLILSNLNLHFINDIMGNLTQIKNALKPGGHFIASFIGGQSLKELREVFYQIEIENYGGISPRIIPFIDVKDAGMLMQNAGFADPVADIEKITIDYSTPQKLFEDLKNMGEGNILHARSRKFMGKKIYQALLNLYQKTYSNIDGEVTASFEIVTIIGRK
jgi:NADH dehydrogenase [ubiquinone] 1 alpha subcomplex assembly factor 5